MRRFWFHYYRHIFWSSQTYKYAQQLSSLKINFFCVSWVFDFFVWSVAIDFTTIPTVQCNCIHINHMCLSATISDLNRLFATAVSGAYRQCLNQNCLIFWKDHRKHLWITVLARLFLPKRKRSKITKRNEHIDIHHHHHQMHQKNILLFNLLS